MERLFSQLAVADIHQELVRNIVSLLESENLFDDLSDEPDAWLLAQQVESDARPYPYRSPYPEIYRPFEEAIWINAIGWPFQNRQMSRFSDGSFGVWYGSDLAETNVFETAYHWYRGLICDAGWEQERVVVERKLYTVACDALLLDLRQTVAVYPDIVHKSDYRFARTVGARLHREGHPGLLTYSARHDHGLNFAVMNPEVLSRPRFHSQLSYCLEGERILVESTPGTIMLDIPINVL